MTRDGKALILIALREMTHRGVNWPNLRMKKSANALTLRAFKLVAGVGFEPTTFRL
jgi:hypothetical protein